MLTTRKTGQRKESKHIFHDDDFSTNNKTRSIVMDVGKASANYWTSVIQLLVKLTSFGTLHDSNRCEVQCDSKSARYPRRSGKSVVRN